MGGGLRCRKLGARSWGSLRDGALPRGGKLSPKNFDIIFLNHLDSTWNFAENQHSFFFPGETVGNSRMRNAMKKKNVEFQPGST